MLWIYSVLHWIWCPSVPQLVQSQVLCKLSFKFFIEDSEGELYRCAFCLYLYFIYFAKLFCWFIGSCFNSLFLRKNYILSVQKPWSSLILMLDLGQCAWHIIVTQRLYMESQEHMRMLVSYCSHSPCWVHLCAYSRASRNREGDCRETNGEQKYVLCLRHQWPSRMWPWTLPQRSGGGWILPRGTWCWRTTGTWSHSVRTDSHCDSWPAYGDLTVLLTVK